MLDGLHYQEFGKGPPILLLHGLSKSARHWLGFDQILSQTFRVITVDHPGIGRSRNSPISWGHTVRKSAQTYASLIRSLNLGKIHVLGVSLGGMIAAELGVIAEDLVESLTIINSSSLTLSAVPRLSPKAMGVILLGGLAPALLPKISANAILSPELCDDRKSKIITRWQEIFELEGLQRTAALKQLLAAASYRFRLPNKHLDYPRTLILYGENDPFVPTSQSSLLAQAIPGATLQALDSLGHEPFLEDPDRVAEQVVKFCL